MLRFISSGLMLFIFVACSTAQNYSSKNKKAISLFKEGIDYATKTADPRTGRPSYVKGLEYMNKALEKDPNFWEAHLAAGEFAEYSNNPEEAKDHYRKAIQINPNHSPSGGTYFLLGSLEYLTGEYDNALKNLNQYIRFQSANPQMVQQSREMIRSSEFAIKAMNNPTPFEPVNLGPGVNTADPEYFPTITVDGKTILFTRLIKDTRVPVYQKQEDFYVSQLSDKNTWMTATPMPANVNTVRNEGAPTIAADGRSLIFVACPDETGTDYGDGRFGKGSCDLFITKKLGAQWVDPVNLPGSVNSSSWETQPSLSSDGKSLYFVRGIRGRGQMGDADIYVSTLMADGRWSQPVKLPETINTPHQEESVLIHPDGKTLYFSSRGHTGMGGLDIFVSRKDANGNWSRAENLGYPINTPSDENSLMVGPDGEIAFFASDRPGGYGDLDIYYFIMPEKYRPTKTLYFDGVVYDIETGKKIPGKFSLKDLKTGQEIVRSEADPVTGAFTVSLPVNQEYALSVSYPDYLDYSANFNMTAVEGQESVHQDVPMVPKTSSQPVALRNVFFDLNKSTLRPESYLELNVLRDYMKANPSLKFEISGHTDTRGDATENLTLSQGRAKSVYDYLVSQGIDAKRLTHKGYGETKPLVTDDAIAKMATEREKEAAHQLNRRTEYRIVK